MQFLLRVISIFILVIICFGTPAQAQFPLLRNFNLEVNKIINPNSNNLLASDCIRLDGICLYSIAALETDISTRVGEIQDNFMVIEEAYFMSNRQKINIYQQEIGNIIDIYVRIDSEEFRLMTVTPLDAEIVGSDIQTRANEIIQIVERSLKKAKLERQPKFLLRQGLIAISITGIVLLANLYFSRKITKLKESKQVLTASKNQLSQFILVQFSKNLNLNINEIKYRLLQLGQIVTLMGGTLIILGLFPYTRMAQTFIISIIRIPIRLGIVGVATYLSIRFSYALINKFTSKLVGDMVGPAPGIRSQLRLATISGVTKSIVTITCIAAGIIIGLSSIGVNVAPLLAGAGILGFGLSLASQNLIKDALNGFFIILEDQYAIGDVINIGNVAGLVENINLRITQLRDAEGRLITIPNSEISIVANLSSKWSRADLNIPIAYETDVDLALDLLDKLATTMCQEDNWCNQIIDKPEILGVDKFGDRGFIIKVWIKTRPLQQWAVSREFRRRVKVAFDAQGIYLSLSQEKIWFHETSYNQVQFERKSSSEPEIIDN